MLEMIDKTGSVGRWVKWVIVLLVLRRDRAVQWSSFLSLNPLIKKVVRSVVEKSNKSKFIDKSVINGSTVNGSTMSDFNGSAESVSTSDASPSVYSPLVSQISNFISGCLLMSAVVDNPKIPSDYGVVYVFSNYIGELNPPSHSQILVTPKSSRYFKISYYNSDTLRYLYNHKQFVVFPVIFAQILSNYLTPTTYKLNQRYLSSSIKTRILNPIWINYTLSVNHMSLSWLKLLRSYVLHNAAFVALFGVLNFKKRVLDHYYELKHGVYNSNELTSFKDVVLNYMAYVMNKANSMTNFIYLPNLVSIFLISVTSGSIKYFYQSPHKKLLFKSYIKIIGFIAGFITLVVNNMEVLPDFGYVSTTYDEENDHNYQKRKIRTLTPGFFNALNLYLVRLIVLQKYRILKENHPFFNRFKLSSWNKLESLIFCLGVFKLMNLNDFLKTTRGKDYGLRDNSLIKMVNKIM